MDIKRTFVGLLFIFGIGFGFVKLKKGFLKLMDIDVRQHEEVNRVLPDDLSRWGFGQYLRAGKTFQNEIALAGISKECEPYVKAIEELDLISYSPNTRARTYQNLIRIPSACSITDEWVAAAEKDYLKKCFFTNPDINETLSPECAYTIYSLRSMMTQMLLKSTRLEEVDTLGKLTDLLYAEVMKTRLTTVDYPLDRFRAKQIVKQMLEVNPSFKAAKRVSFFLKAQDAIAEAPSKSPREIIDIWNDLQKEFDRDKEFNAMDGYNQGYETLIQTHGYDTGLTLQYSTKLMAANPNSAWAMLLSAYAHWKQADHETAFKEVKAATMLAPGNKDYQEVETLLSRSGAGEEAFAPGLKLILSPQDFDK